MEKELIELFEATKKAADAVAAEGASSIESEESRCLDALKQLKNFPVTYQALVSTQVGKRLRHLTKHPSEKIQAVASNLLEKWKKIVIEETSRNNKNESMENESSAKVKVAKAETIKVEKVSKEDSAKVGKVSKTETVKIVKINQGGSVKSENVSRSETVTFEEVQTLRVEKIPKEEKQASGVKRSSQAPIGTPKLASIVKCNDAMRDKVRELLSEAFSKVSSEVDEDIRDEVDACDPIRVAVSVESVMFEKWGRSNGAQKLKYRSVMFNIKDPNNPDLRRKVLLGHVKPERLLNMTPEEMASDQRQRENKQIKERALFECERGGQSKASTDQFKCGRCGQRKCTYYQMQTRSADEPMTTYVTCVNCNNRWKFC